MPANYVLLSEVTVGAAGAASVTFSNIPQTGYTDLKVAYSARSTGAAARIDIRWYFNSDTSGSNYSYRRLFGYESGVLSGSGSGTYTDAGTAITGSTATASTFSNNELYIPNYTGSAAKSASGDWIAENNSSSSFILGINANLWNQTAAISSITFSPSSGNFAANSTFYLYGLAAVGTTPVIAPFASGGDIIQNDGTYWIHTFLSSGTFTPAKALTCDALVIAGGGGGNNGRAGGGAGGYRTVTGLSTTAQAYTITVGAGGAGGAQSAGTYFSGVKGSNSVFSTITSTGGGNAFGGSAVGNTGGSGSGAQGANAGGAGNEGGYSPVEGYAGGAGSSSSSQFGGGGGGGASAVGTAGSGSGGGAGGAGASSSITGSAVTRGGGGGGSGYSGGGSVTGGAGGAGGGGAGSNSHSTAGTSGTANTGGGGGAGATSDTNISGGGAGGSGVVIIRYPMV
jgi:hypothetical protein